LASALTGDRAAKASATTAQTHVRGRPVVGDSTKFGGMDEISRISAAVIALDPQARQYRWTSLTYCIVDAVWSIGSDYEKVVIKMVKNVADVFDDKSPTIAAETALPEDPVPLESFLERFQQTGALLEITNDQLTSPRNGTLKAEVVRQHAERLHDANVDTLAEAQELLDDPARTEEVDHALRGLPGDGQYGVRRGHFWMLVGDESRVKPDRMVLRWLLGQGSEARDPASAAVLLRQVAERLTASGRPTTPWEVDHAIWLAQKKLLNQVYSKAPGREALVHRHVGTRR
jgi:hypothetical protein